LNNTMKIKEVACPFAAIADPDGNAIVLHQTKAIPA